MVLYNTFNKLNKVVGANWKCIRARMFTWWRTGCCFVSSLLLSNMSWWCRESVWTAVFRGSSNTCSLMKTFLQSALMELQPQSINAGLTRHIKLLKKTTTNNTLDYFFYCKVIHLLTSNHPQQPSNCRQNILSTAHSAWFIFCFVHKIKV